jgi:hypothetical protein
MNDSDPLLRSFKDLDEIERRLKETGALIIPNREDFFHMDMILVALINRSLSLNSAFAELLLKSNYMAAVHLVRLHLDSYLRLFAFTLVDNPLEMAADVFNGKKFSTIRDRNDNCFIDRHLKEMAQTIKPWVRDVYDTCSGYVHFTNKHIFLTSKQRNDRRVEFFISVKDKYVHDEARINAIDGMIAISNNIIDLILDRLLLKKNASFDNAVILKTEFREQDCPPGEDEDDDDSIFNQ